MSNLRKPQTHLYCLTVADQEANLHVTLQHDKEYTEDQFFEFVKMAFIDAANIRTAQQTEYLDDMRQDAHMSQFVALEESNGAGYFAARLYPDAVTLLIARHGFSRPITTAAVYLDGTRDLSAPSELDDMYPKHEHTDRLAEQLLKDCPNLHLRPPCRFV